MTDAETPITQSTVGDSEQTIQELPGTQLYEEEKGIDVSHYQKEIDWKKVAKAGVRHVFIKMSQGASWVDKKFVDNWKGASNEKIKVNCYHYFMALDPIDRQFANIKKNVQTVGFGSENSLAIDVEKTGNEKATPSQVAKNLKELLKLIEKDAVFSGKAPMIYTSVGYWDSNVNYKEKEYNFEAYPLWVAHYTTERPKIPAPWRDKNKSWVWWQYSDSGKVDGIEQNVDMDKVKVQKSALENRIPHFM